jgi:nitrogen PTS system EIIA component
MLNGLLDALHEGRLIELPDNDKTHALELLANLIEAIPSAPSGTDVAGAVFAREKAATTALGMGWACPHARMASEGDLLCAVGWSPSGIDYGTPGEPPVRLIVMYLIPDNQKNLYLKEIATLAKAIQAHPEYQHLETQHDLNAVRNYLLDMVDLTTGGLSQDVRARMIQLEARRSISPAPSLALEGVQIEPVIIIAGPNVKELVLTQDRDLLESLESASRLADGIAQQGRHDHDGWAILRRNSTHYLGDRIMYDCLAVRSTVAAKKN